MKTKTKTCDLRTAITEARRLNAQPQGRRHSQVEQPKGNTMTRILLNPFAWMPLALVMPIGYFAVTTGADLLFRLIRTW